MMKALIAALAASSAASLPVWPYSRRWGWGPSIGVGLIDALVIVLLLNYVV